MKTIQVVMAAMALAVSTNSPSTALAQTTEPADPPNTPSPSEPAPETSEPAPETSEPAPETSEPAPEPAPQPVPKVDEAAGAEKAPPDSRADAKSTSEPAVSAAPPPEKDEQAEPIDPVAVARSFSFNSPDADIRVKPVAEIGALFVLWHRYQGGSDGTDFNLRRDGGQASAVLSWRISAEAELFRRHSIILLYQPINLRTRATLRDDLRVNGLTFPARTPMQFRYGFDFYRLSYLYDFLPEIDQELALGLSLQLRVADLEFASLDGSLQRTSQNLGPVPLVKLRGRYTFDNDVFIGTEIDGIGIRFPSEQDSVLGLFFDTSLRVGYSPTKFLETFANIRYVGGGARGPGSEPLSAEFGDGFNNNFIHVLNFSVGFAVK